MVTVNGEARDLAGRVLLDCLTEMGCSTQRVAVERNGQIVPKAQYAETVLQDGDELEVVRFVGGG